MTILPAETRPNTVYGTTTEFVHGVALPPHPGVDSKQQHQYLDDDPHIRRVWYPFETREYLNNWNRS